MRCARMLPLLGWTVAAACSGGEERRESASSDAAPTRSMSITRGTVPMTIRGRVARHEFAVTGTG